MIRLIVEVQAPDVDANVPGVYKTFDIVNKEFEQFFASGLKPIVGHEIRPDPVPPKPVELVKKADENTLSAGLSALELYKHGKAVELNKSGKLPAKNSDKETLLERYQRYMDGQKAASDAETAKNRKASNDNNDEKARQEFNKRVKGFQAAWDRRKWWNVARRIPRPTKESIREAEKAAA